MAEIFRGKAVAAGGFEKPVAIKRILPHLSQDKRFVELLLIGQGHAQTIQRLDKVGPPAHGLTQVDGCLLRTPQADQRATHDKQ